MASSYANITDDTLVAQGPGKLTGFFVSSVSGTPTIALYDGEDDDDPVLVNTFTPVAAKFYKMPGGGLQFTRGLFAAIGETLDCTLFFEGSAVPRPMVAAFSGTPLSGAGPLSVDFTDLSSNFPDTWSWEKNNGGGWVAFAGTPTVQNPTESFATGTWSVRLTASSAGRSDVETKTDYVAAS